MSVLPRCTTMREEPSKRPFWMPVPGGRWRLELAADEPGA